MKKILFFILLLLCFPVLADVLSDTPESFRQFERTYHVSPIFFAMSLTAIIETFLLWCFKYRGWTVLTYFFILNLISNFIINTIYDYSGDGLLVPALEVGAVVFEAGLLGLMTGYNKKMWLSVLATNLISFLTGVLLFGL